MKRHARAVIGRCSYWGLIGALLLTLAGCGADNSRREGVSNRFQTAQTPIVQTPGDTPSDSGTSSVPPVALPAADAAPPAPGAGLDDPLTAGADPLAEAPDPSKDAGSITSGIGETPADPGAHAAEVEKLKALKPGTIYPHWLHGNIINGHVVVTLNGLRLGNYTGPVDVDVGLKLNKGMNTITFDYQPETATAAATLDLLEVNHDPPIGPLASLRTRLPSTITPQTPMTKSVMFLAQ